MRNYGTYIHMVSETTACSNENCTSMPAQVRESWSVSLEIKIFIDPQNVPVLNQGFPQGTTYFGCRNHLKFLATQNLADCHSRRFHQNPATFGATKTTVFWHCTP